MLRLAVLTALLLLGGASAFADTSAFSKWQRSGADDSLAAEIAAITRQALSDAILHNRIRPPKPPKSPLLQRPAAVFATIVNDRGVVRGCMGSLSGAEPTAAAEIVRATYLAATADTRYAALKRSELGRLDVLISICGPRTRVHTMSQLDPLRLGLLVQGGPRAAVLLPGEALSPGWQLQECRRKAGIPARDKVSMYTFPTVVFQVTSIAAERAGPRSHSWDGQSPPHSPALRPSAPGRALIRGTGKARPTHRRPLTWTTCLGTGTG